MVVFFCFAPPQGEGPRPGRAGPAGRPRRPSKLAFSRFTRSRHPRGDGRRRRHPPTGRHMGWRSPRKAAFLPRRREDGRRSLRLLWTGRSPGDEVA